MTAPSDCLGHSVGLFRDEESCSPILVVAGGFPGFPLGSVRRRGISRFGLRYCATRFWRVSILSASIHKLSRVRANLTMSDGQVPRWAMLPNCYRWTDNPDTCYLGLNYWQVAVLKLVDGKVHGSVTWQGRVHTFRAGSFSQAKRWTERWVAAQGNSLPSKPAVRGCGEARAARMAAHYEAARSRRSASRARAPYAEGSPGEGSCSASAWPSFHEG